MLPRSTKKRTLPICSTHQNGFQMLINHLKSRCRYCPCVCLPILPLRSVRSVLSPGHSAPTHETRYHYTSPFTCSGSQEETAEELGRRKRQEFWTRTRWTFAMFLSFMFVIASGQFYVAVMLPKHAPLHAPLASLSTECSR